MLGPNNNSSATADLSQPGTPNRPCCTLGYQSFDANVTHDPVYRVPGTKSIRFDFIFGSEEFPEWVHTAFNDTFGAFLDGVQISKDSKGNTVSVNNVFFSLNNNSYNDTANPPLDNAGNPITGTTSVRFGGAGGTQYDGLTPRLTTQAPLDPNVTGVHTLTLAIDDEGDHVLDSGVFLARLRGDAQTGGGETNEDPTANPGGPYTTGVGQTITLDASGSLNPNGAVSSLSFKWDLNSTGVYNTTGMTVPFSKTTPGVYTVGLEVIDRVWER